MNQPIVFHSITNFYALEGMKAEMQKVSKKFLFVKSFERLWADIEEYGNKYNKKLAQLLFDHTVLSVQAELRHAKQQCYYYIPNYLVFV